MEYVVTKFDKQLWDAHGADWCRTVKSRGYTGVILDNGIPDAAKDKANQLRFRIIPLEKSETTLGTLKAFVSQIKPGESWLYLKAPTVHWLDCGASNLLTVLKTPGDIDVSCLASLQDRVKFTNLMRDSSEYRLSSDVISGGFHAWNTFVGFYSFVLATAMLDTAGDATEFVLNVFGNYFPDLVQHGGGLSEDQPDDSRENRNAASSPEIE